MTETTAPDVSTPTKLGVDHGESVAPRLDC